MNVHLLIDNIVRQTMVLIAQLATSSGSRAPLAHVAGQVFLELVEELKSQGLGNKVIADMFGLALRTYRDRVRRLAESSTFRGVTLWEAVLNYVRENGLVARAEVLRRFRADDELSVRGVLNDLVESGLLFRSGRADTTTFRAAAADELFPANAQSNDDALANLLWVQLHQQGPSTLESVEKLFNLDPEPRQALVQKLLQQLTAEGRVRYDVVSGCYSVEHCVIPPGAEHGWEASVMDHYQAVVNAIANKVSQGQHASSTAEFIGGSTYHFDLHPDHPEEQEVLGLLRVVRERVSELRERARPHNLPQHEEHYRVTFYLGQNVTGKTSKEDSES